MTGVLNVDPEGVDMNANLKPIYSTHLLHSWYLFHQLPEFCGGYVTCERQ